jgi:hypothetical protein
MMPTDTTDTGSAENPMTYLDLARQCEQLTAISKHMSDMAWANENFVHEPEFQRLRAKFKEVLLDVNSLDIV